MSKAKNIIKIIFSIVLVVAGAIALYVALNLGNPSVCQDGSCDVSSQVTPARFSEYSWEDISHIADQIKNTSSTDEAQAVARRYNLIDANNNLTSETNYFITNDGVRIDFRIIGIAADEGSGLTLMSSSASYYHNINRQDTTDGSWKESGVRKWLNNEILDSFPDEVKGAIKPVEKLTNNADAGGVKHGTINETTDSLWLLSASEICGNINWFTSRYQVRNSDNVDNTLSSQGSQYRYFKENNVGPDTDPNGVLKLTYDGKPVSWWMRSPYLFKLDSIDSNFWFDVTSEGYPFNYLSPNSESGIIFGFCI